MAHVTRRAEHHLMIRKIRTGPDKRRSSFVYCQAKDKYSPPPFTIIVVQNAFCYTVLILIIVVAKWFRFALLSEV